MSFKSITRKKAEFLLQEFTNRHTSSIVLSVADAIREDVNTVETPTVGVTKRLAEDVFTKVLRLLSMLARVLVDAVAEDISSLERRSAVAVERATSLQELAVQGIITVRSKVCSKAGFRITHSFYIPWRHFDCM